MLYKFDKLIPTFSYAFCVVLFVIESFENPQWGECKWRFKWRKRWQFSECKCPSVLVICCWWSPYELMFWMILRSHFRSTTIYACYCLLCIHRCMLVAVSIASLWTLRLSRLNRSSLTNCCYKKGVKPRDNYLYDLAESSQWRPGCHSMVQKWSQYWAANDFASF